MGEPIKLKYHSTLLCETDVGPYHKAIGCRWMFVVKFNPDGSVAKLKVRLIVKSYAQIYGVDYSDTFYPVAKLIFVRLLISLATSYDWNLHQLDVRNAYLHGDL